MLDQGDLVFATSWGNAYGPDAGTGRILRHNNLPGSGHGDVMMAVGDRRPGLKKKRGPRRAPAFKKSVPGYFTRTTFTPCR